MIFSSKENKKLADDIKKIEEMDLPKEVKDGLINQRVRDNFPDCPQSEIDSIKRQLDAAFRDR